MSSGSRCAASIHSIISGIAMIRSQYARALLVELHVVGQETRRPPARTSRRPCCAACRTGTARHRWRGTRARSSAMRSMSAWARAQILCPGNVALEVHRQRRAQAGEARVHLAADRAAMRARHAVGRQQAGVGLDLVQVLGDRQRVPDLDAVVRRGTARGSTATAAATPCGRRRRRAGPSSRRTPARRSARAASRAATTTNSSCC